jgi:hypothetical protein
MINDETLVLNPVHYDFFMGIYIRAKGAMFLENIRRSGCRPRLLNVTQVYYSKFKIARSLLQHVATCNNHGKADETHVHCSNNSYHP